MQTLTAFGIALVAAASLPGCTTVPPDPATPMVLAAPTASSQEAPRLPRSSAAPVEADGYALGSWRLGQPLGALTSKQELWDHRHFDAGGGGQFAMSISPWKAVRGRDETAGIMVFFGSGSAASFSDAEKAQVPSLVVVLGPRTLESFQPPLPALDSTDEALGPVTFVVEKGFDSDESVALDSVVPPLPRSPDQAPPLHRLRVEEHGTRMARVMIDTTRLGYVLGPIPNDANDRLYNGLGRLTRRYLGTR